MNRAEPDDGGGRLAQGDKVRFRRLCATCLDQPRRPASLDTLLSEIAARKDH